MSNPLNQHLIHILEKYVFYLEKHKDIHKIFRIKKALEALMVFKENIYNVEEVKEIKGVGNTTYLILKEYCDTGKVEYIETEKKNPLYSLCEVYGIGAKKANELISKNITSIKSLNKNLDQLNNVQKIGLQYYDEIKEKISRDEIDLYKNIFTKLFDEINDGFSSFEIVGSYRRMAEQSGDIDFIISNQKDNSGIFDKFLDILKKKNYIVEFLSRGSVKSLTIAKLPGKIARRLDFLYSPPNEFSYAILYFTGSKYFNTAMRQRALDLGFSLNEHRLINKETKEVVCLDMKTEKHIFHFLGMKFKKPDERINANSIELLEVTDAQETFKIKKRKTLKKKQSNTCLDKLNHFQKTGVSYLNTLSLGEVEEMITLANKKYHNAESVINDELYDILFDYLNEKNPTSQIVSNVGANIEKNKVLLPYHMASMNKIKPDTNAVDKWLSTYNSGSMITTKLDGVSGLYTTESSSGEPKLYTRGNGKYGQDVSHLISYLNLPKQKNIVVRGEFIISKQVFDEKYKGQFSNPRNLVSGLVNSQKNGQEKYPDISFIVYEVIKPVLKPSEQVTFASKLGFVFCKNVYGSTVSNDKLSEILIEWRQNYEYQIDGLVVTDDKIYPRFDKNPDQSFAFKMVLQDQVAEAKVVDVLWSASKDGYLKPRIKIEKISLCGVDIEYATGFNGKFIRDNCINIGSIVKLVRSGDVIPHIIEVIQPAKYPNLPEIEYDWTESGVDIVVKDKSTNQEVLEKNLTLFFKTIETEGVSDGTIKRLVKSGYNSIPKIISMKVEDFMKLDGFKEKKSIKTYESIQNAIKKNTLEDLMCASNIFGRGLGPKRLSLILETYPDILTNDVSNKDKVGMITEIKGMSTKTAELFVTNIEPFVCFIKEANLSYKIQEVQENKQVINTYHLLYGKKIVMSGFRDKELMGFIKKVGGINENQITKDTFALIIKDLELEGSKKNTAIKQNIPIYSITDFIVKFIKSN
jgi:DNA ligase (NAD+)